MVASGDCKRVMGANFGALQIRRAECSVDHSLNFNLNYLNILWFSMLLYGLQWYCITISVRDGVGNIYYIYIFICIQPTIKRAISFQRLNQ